MKKTLLDLHREIVDLEFVDFDSRVRAAKELVRKERAPKIAELKKQAEALRAKRPEKKPRWPENTPASIVKFCEQYWGGTEEYRTFRIHCWNDKGVCTSYPSGGYSNNGGWNKTSACFHFVSLTEKDYGRAKRLGDDLEGRQSQKQLEDTLTEYTNKLVL